MVPLAPGPWLPRDGCPGERDGLECRPPRDPLGAHVTDDDDKQPDGGAEARLILVEGPAPTPTLELAQRLALQLAHRGQEVELLTPRERGHPLLREGDRDAASERAALLQQWRNFGTRAAAGTSCWIAASSWLPAAAANGRDPDGPWAGEQLGTLDAVRTDLLMLSTVQPRDPADAEFAASAFATITAPRTLLNSDRMRMDELLAEGLALLGTSPLDVEFDAALAGRLLGRYGDLRIEADGAGLRLGAPFLEADAELLPGPDGRLHPAGVAMTLTAVFEGEAPCAGLLVTTSDPAFSDVGDYLPRTP